MKAGKVRCPSCRRLVEIEDGKVAVHRRPNNGGRCRSGSGSAVTVVAVSV